MALETYFCVPFAPILACISFRCVPDVEIQKSLWAFYCFWFLFDGVLLTAIFLFVVVIAIVFGLGWVVVSHGDTVYSAAIRNFDVAW